VLDSYEVGIVHAANPDLAHLHRPITRIVCSPEGAVLRPGTLVNLAETKPDGSYRRAIIKVTDAARFGINPADYFV
jgi:hypothetical protein